MCLDHITAEDLVRTDTTVIRALRSWEAVLGPAIWPVVGTEQGVFLLQTKPGLMLSVRLHQPSSFVAVVEFVGAAIPVPGFAEHEDVVTTT